MCLLISGTPNLKRHAEYAARAEQKVKRGTRTAKSMRAIAVELLLVNFAAIARNFEIFHVPGVALNAAGGDVMDDAFAPASKSRGIENAGVSTKGQGNVALPMVTVDGLTTMFGWNSTVYFLSIDTEGQDAGVLKGAERGLEAKEFRVVEFEYHRKGQWRVVSLNRTVGSSSASTRRATGASPRRPSRNDSGDVRRESASSAARPRATAHEFSRFRSSCKGSCARAKSRQ